MVVRKEVALDRIFLDLENPRHEPYENQSQVIEYLCRRENVLALARDIATNGLNPIELFALIQDGDDQGAASYFVAEGNRRICALKLLHDPDLAPSAIKKGIEQAAKGWAGVSGLPCVIFDDRDSVDLWLTRIHDGEQDGVGRRKWSADQSQRHSGSTKNKIALDVLDYAEKKGLITSEDRKGKLTTVSRYVTKKPVQEAMGLDVTDLNELKITKSSADFDAILTKFLGDLESGHVNSRVNGADAFKAYGRELKAVKQSSKGEVTSHSLNEPTTSAKDGTKRRRRKIKDPTTLPFEHEIMDGLKGLNSQKLINLYDSICSVPLNPHAPLISIGMWAFFESLSARAGRNALTDFQSFFSKTRLQNYGVSTGKGDKAISEALRRVSASGDVTKHDGTAAMFNGAQMANDMETLKKLVIACVAEAASQPS